MFYYKLQSDDYSVVLGHEREYSQQEFSNIVNEALNSVVSSLKNTKSYSNEWGKLIDVVGQQLCSCNGFELITISAYFKLSADTQII